MLQSMLVRIRMLHSWKSRSSIPSPLFFNHHNSTGSPTITQTTFSYLVCQFFVPAAARRGILDDLHGIRNAKPVPIVWSTFGSLLYGFEGLQVSLVSNEICESDPLESSSSRLCIAALRYSTVHIYA